jgi:serine/threonine-protein kinase
MSATGPGDTIGPYVLRSLLGEGGMGRVFLADRPPGTEAYAIKVIRDELASDPAITRRFLREAEATSRVRHPRLIEVVDTGTDGGRPYLAMRHIDGASLDQLVKDHGPLQPATGATIIADAAGALDALHEVGLVHRDIKPSNLMVDGDGRATLMDLGLARGPEMSVLTKTNAVVGTLGYLAPELIRGSADASPASDIYALGCVAFEAFAGRAPFVGGIFEIGLAHLEHPPPDIHALRPELPETASEAISLALAKSPERRPRTATAFAMMLGVGLGLGPSRS